MTKTEVDRFRRILTARVAELERFTRQRDGIAVERSADQLEEIQAASQRALAVCNLDREFTQLRNARAALRRIEDGSFGTCQECDEDIHPKRLAAVPWAAFCIRCQEAVDRNFEEIQASAATLLVAPPEGAGRRSKMPKLALLDPTKTGRQAEDLENQLRHLVVGQDEAIHQIVRAYQTHLAGLSPVGRPIGNFLFLGPTGSGKTRIVEATAESLLKNSRAVIKIDCAEFQHSHEIAKLIGSPPGYLGHRETHALLSQEALNQHHTEKIKLSFVLFDEIEKASDALWNLLLGILDKGNVDVGRQPQSRFLGGHGLPDQQSRRGRNELPAESAAGLPRSFHEDSGCDRETQRPDVAHRHRGRPSKVHAGVHQPSGQDRRLQISGQRGTAPDR